MTDTWSRVDEYLESMLGGHDDVLDSALARCRAAHLPPISVTPMMGKFLQILALSIGATRILEIGTLGGYSTIWLARALPSKGSIVTLEVDPVHARVARENISHAGLTDRVDLRVGDAVVTLPTLEGPFDMAFIDADKPSNPIYLRHAERLVRSGGLVVVDNVIRNGAVADSATDDPNALGVRAMNELLASKHGLQAAAIQTVGSKGYDGFTLIRIP